MDWIINVLGLRALDKHNSELTVERRFEGDGRIDRSKKKPAPPWGKFDYYRTNDDGDDSDTTTASGKTVIHSSSAIKKPLVHAKASLAPTAALAVKDNVPPSQASTTDDSATQRGNTDSVFTPADSKTTSKPAIKKVIVREGEFLFEVGFDSPVWLHYGETSPSSQAAPAIESD